MSNGNSNNVVKILQLAAIFVVSFISLMVVGKLLQPFISFISENPGPFLVHAVKLIDFLLPGPSDFLALMVTFIESLIMTFYGSKVFKIN